MSKIVMQGNPSPMIVKGTVFYMFSHKEIKERSVVKLTSDDLKTQIDVFVNNKFDKFYECISISSDVLTDYSILTEVFDIQE